jgi:hypothetical protein
MSLVTSPSEQKKSKNKCKKNFLKKLKKRTTFFQSQTETDPDRKPTFEQKTDPDPDRSQKVNPAGL